MKLSKISPTISTVSNSIVAFVCLLFVITVIAWNEKSRYTVVGTDDTSLSGCTFRVYGEKNGEWFVPRRIIGHDYKGNLLGAIDLTPYAMKWRDDYRGQKRNMSIINGFIALRLQEKPLDKPVQRDNWDIAIDPFFGNDRVYWHETKKQFDERTYTQKIKIHSDVPELLFKITEKADTRSESGSRVTVEVRDSASGNLLQEFTIREPDFIVTDSHDVFEFSDMNFDGYLDLRIFNSVASGTSGTWYETFLYDPTKNLFVYNKIMSIAPTGVVDSVNKRIYSSGFSGSSCSEYINRFVVKSNKLYIERLTWHEEGYLLDNGQLLTSGKEFERIRTSTERSPDCVTFFAIPNTKDGLMIAEQYIIPKKFKIKKKIDGDAVKWIMQGMPNDEILRNLSWVSGTPDDTVDQADQLIRRKTNSSIQ